MGVYKLHPGGATMLIDASSEARAREALGHKLGYATKPWLWKKPIDDRPDPLGVVRLATDAEIGTWRKQRGEVPKASEMIKRDPTKSNPPRRQKASR
jgi:hypothetical protein